MMSRKVIILLALMAVVLCADAQDKCPPTQVWNECGSKCPRTCEDPNPICIEECVEKCECPFGLVLDDNRCINPNDCEQHS